MSNEVRREEGRKHKRRREERKLHEARMVFIERKEEKKKTVPEQRWESYGLRTRDA